MSIKVKIGDQYLFYKPGELEFESYDKTRRGVLLHLIDRESVFLSQLEIDAMWDSLPVRKRVMLTSSGYIPSAERQKENNRT
jgi:hypothetical protein